MIIKKILYVRSAPYKVNPNSYNLQEIGFSRELCKRGIDCDILYYSDENKDELIYQNGSNRVLILWRKGIRLLRSGIYPQILKKDIINKYDLVITTEYGQIMSLLCSRYKPKTVLYNGPYYNLFKIPPMEKIYDLLFVKSINKNMEKIFTKSKISEKYLNDKGLSNTETLGVGLDINIFEKEVEITSQVSNIIKFMENNKCLLYVGSLDDRKNFRFTLKVFEKINKINPHIKLIVIGKGKESYVKKSFEIIDENVVNNILHINQIENKFLKYIYPLAKVFILPSKLEIFGMVLLEAMYFGLPTITSINGGSTTLIENGLNGIMMNGFVEEEWSNEILKLVNNDEYRNKISENATKTILEGFTWKMICNKFMNSIDKIEK